MASFSLQFMNIGWACTTALHEQFMTSITVHDKKVFLMFMKNFVHVTKFFVHPTVLHDLDCLIIVTPVGPIWCTFMTLISSLQ